MKFICIMGVIIFALFSVALALKDPICGEKPAANGDCVAFEPRFSYHPETNVCKKFIFNGCRINANNFLTIGACQKKCQE